MNFLNWLSLLATLFGVAFAFYAYFENRKKQFAWAIASGLMAMLCLLAAFLSIIIPFSERTTTSGSTNPTPQVTVVQTPQKSLSPTTETTPTPTETPTPSPTQISPGNTIYTADFTHKAAD